MLVDFNRVDIDSYKQKLGTQKFMDDAAAQHGKYCIGCGKSLHFSADTCPNCGAKQPGATGNKSRITAALLAIFLGGFGAHKFYLGRLGQGLLYLLFFWTFIPAVLAFIEFIIYLTMTDEAFAEKYG